MTFEEFMYHAHHEIDDAFKNQRIRMMNLVEQAWTEGKKNAEAEVIEQKATDILEALRKQISDAAEASKSYIDPPDMTTLPYKPIRSDWCENDIPAGCRYCSNHPINGGSGICHCIVGTQPIMCNSTATDICTAIEKDKMSVSDEVMSALGGLRDKEVYNTCCDNHIKIIHDMMTGVKKDGENN